MVRDGWGSQFVCFALNGLRWGGIVARVATGSRGKWMTAYLFSCENATCAVPEAHRELFRGSEEVVTSTEGWEPGALNLAQGFAMRFRTPLVHGDLTRLLIDLEKDGDARWSRFSLKLPEATRGKLVERHERKYRLLLHQRIAEDLRRHESLLHVMVHTVSEVEGVVSLETVAGAALAEELAAAWRSSLLGMNLDVRHSKGAAQTGLGASLAAEYPVAKYAQVRLLVSQSFFLEGKPLRWETLKKGLLDSLAAAVKSMNS